jgi:UDP-2-acetamido-3-amino-2,3-dideoxy-glucuronate N-acetyltransferase
VLARIHSTAIVEQGVQIGQGSAIWDHVHIRRGAKLGDECIVGEKTHIAYDVSVGNRVKINAFVYICTGVSIEDGVMISAGTVFTNDRAPRATTPDLMHLRTSAPDGHTRRTLVREGATIGARCVIGCDLTIGRFAMVGMGSIVTRSVPDFHLTIGHPARSAGFVCRCGNILLRFDGAAEHQLQELRCSSCALSYLAGDGVVREIAWLHNAPPELGDSAPTSPQLVFDKRISTEALQPAFSLPQRNR